jgi:hypothetical protein
MENYQKLGLNKDASLIEVRKAKDKLLALLEEKMAAGEELLSRENITETEITDFLTNFEDFIDEYSDETGYSVEIEVMVRNEAKRRYEKVKRAVIINQEAVKKDINLLVDLGIVKMGGIKPIALYEKVIIELPTLISKKPGISQQTSANT